MVSISEVSIISIDKSEDPWAIEGEILFESDLSTPFSTLYYSDDDEFESLEIEINPGKFDKTLLKHMILSAVQEFDDY